MRHVFASLLAGAAVGALAVLVTALFVDLELAAITLPGGIGGGMAMSLVALRVRAHTLVRLAWLVVTGPFAVFLAELLFLVSFPGSDPGFELAGATMTALCALPGIGAGALVLQAAIRPDVDADGRVEDLRRSLAREMPVATDSALRALADPSDRLRALAIRWIAMHHPDPVRHLREHVARDRDLEVIARELVVFEHDDVRRMPGAEELLLEVLRNGSWNDQRAAIRSLGYLGGRAAVAELQELLALGYLELESRAAIRRILPRLSGAEPGQLSVTSPADDRAGSLSVPLQPGALSKPS